MIPQVSSSQITTLGQIFHNETNIAQHSSYFTEHTNFFRKVEIISTISKCQPRQTFGAYLCSVGTQHGNLHQLSVTTSRATDIILQAHTRTGVSHSKHWKNSAEVLQKKTLLTTEWKERVWRECKVKGRTSGNRWSIKAVFWPTPSLKKVILGWLGTSSIGGP